MNINETKSALLQVLGANPHQAIFLWGLPGVGKSDMVSQICDEMERDMIDIRLSQMDPSDMKGIPSVVDGMTVFNEPVELPRDVRDFLFLDECNAAPRAVQAASMQLILDRALGSYKVPDGVPILAAGNRVKDGAVANRMPTALNNRFMHFTVEPDLGTMVEYALDKDWPMELIQFLRFRPNLLHDMPSTLGDGEPFPSPRSWEMVVNSKALDIADSDLRRFVIQGAVGTGAMVELEGFISTITSLPNLDVILASPRDAEIPTKPAALYAVAGALAEKADTFNLMSVMTYLERIPDKEYTSMAVTTMLRKKPDLANSSTLVGWLARNRRA